MVEIIYGGGGGDNIRRRRQWWRSYSEASVSVEIIYRDGGDNYIGGGDIMWDFVGELVHSQWKPHKEI